MLEEVSQTFKIPETAIYRMLSDRTVRRHTLRDSQTSALKFDPDGVARMLKLYWNIKWDK
jgi:hypothetical protein